MSLTYVIPDLHGRYDLLMASLARIEELSPEGGTIVFLGDYVDRGPQSMEILDRLMAGPPPNWTWHCILGNHEDMMMEVGDPSHSDHGWWIGNGGDTTIQSYGGKDHILQQHLKWLQTLPRLHFDDHRVYTHAGVSEEHSLSEQPEQITQWYRYPKGADVGWHDKHVVHGHTPKGPELFEKRTNLDAGAVFRNKIAIGVFDDDVAGGPIKVGFVEPVKVEL